MRLIFAAGSLGAANLLWAAVQLLHLIQNWIAGPTFLVASIPLYVARIPREEEMMLDEFGNEYRRYVEWMGAGWCRGGGDSLPGSIWRDSFGSRSRNGRI